MRLIAHCKRNITACPTPLLVTRGTPVALWETPTQGVRTTGGILWAILEAGPQNPKQRGFWEKGTLDTCLTRTHPKGAAERRDSEPYKWHQTSYCLDCPRGGPLPRHAVGCF